MSLDPSVPSRRSSFGAVDSLIKILGEIDRFVHFEQFLSGVLRTFAEYAGCDTARLVFHDGGQYYACETGEKAEAACRVRTGRYEDGLEFFGRRPAESGLEKLTGDIFDGKFDGEIIVLSKSADGWTCNRAEVAAGEFEASVSSEAVGIRLGPTSRESVLLPFDLHGRTAGVIQLESEIAGLFTQGNLPELGYLKRIFVIAWRQWNLKISLRERVKEQTCLYSIARLVAHSQWTLSDVVRQAVDILPPGWLYPEIAVARIVIDNVKFESFDFASRLEGMNADILVDGKKRGYVEVAYIEEKPRLDEGPFLAEERKLLDAVAGELSFIIKHKEDRERNQDLQSQLQYANQMAVLGQFAAGMAHELNDPLGSVLGFAQLVLKNKDLPSQIKQDVDKIIAAALKARDIMKKLDVFTGSETSSRTGFDLNEVIDDAFRSLKPRFLTNDIELICEFSENLPMIYADRSQIIQALIHLVVNAVQAMTEGGRLYLRTSAEPGFVIITVEDTGVGIPPEILENLFNPFFTTKDVNEGKGLGLSIVHGIIRSHGGTIQAASEPGEGTRFVIKLPTR